MPGTQSNPGKVATIGKFGAQVASAINPWIGLGTTVAGLIPRPDYTKIEAAGTQQNLEKVALEIEQRVNAGEIDPDAALGLLANLEQRAAGLGGIGAGTPGGTAAYGRGGVNANNIIQQVKANITAKRNTMLSSPLDQAKGLTGSPQFQAQQFGSLIRNRLLGTEAGQSIAGTPVDRLIQPRPSPTASLGSTSEALNAQFPSITNPNEASSFADSIRKRIQDYTATPVRY